MAGRVLFISNGHGEDNDSSFIIRALRERAPDVEIAAVPIVGLGNEYRKLDVPILGPTQEVPSGGFTYVNRLLLLKDIRHGLIGLTLRQIAAVRREAPAFDMVMAVGDVVAQSFAWVSGRPYLSFITSLSALYEGTLRLDPVVTRAVKARRSHALLTRDKATAEDLSRQGFRNVRFAGIPSLDWIVPEGRDLSLAPGQRLIGMLPGSRLPEALRNFVTMLRFAEKAHSRVGGNVAFRAALVPRVFERRGDVAQGAGWTVDGNALRHAGGAEVLCYADAFNDIASRSEMVIGMAGLAVDQSVALGAPVIQIAGEGPQFNHRFAEAQDRLLGLAAQTVGLTGPAGEAELDQAAALLERSLGDPAFLSRARADGIARLGEAGGAYRIADLIVETLGTLGAR